MKNSGPLIVSFTAYASLAEPLVLGAGHALLKHPSRRRENQLEIENLAMLAASEVVAVEPTNYEASMSYQQFIATKTVLAQPTGISDFGDLPPALLPHQADLVKWALRRGRAAIFADTGLGKTLMELAWADAIHRATGKDVLILAPLAVAAQTVAEGIKFGIKATHARDGADVLPGINVTNYDRLHRFSPSAFGAVVLDESSCIKHHTSKTFDTLVEAFSNCPYRLCATATPAPNDWTELGTHAEFLGICTRSEMLSEYFVHDAAKTQDWRLKGHARGQFWQWVASWGAMVRKPSDLGHDDSLYNLPPLTVTEHLVDSDDSGLVTEGMLFALEASSMSERRAARKSSLDERVQACADVANADGEPWIVWGELNAETEALTKSIDGAVEIRGSDDVEVKEQRLADFANGKIRVLVTKPKIAGWGLNWQHCARMAFVGVTDSFESYYQATRRCWRFGQKREVEVHLFSSGLEGAVLTNLKRKESDAARMGEELSAETREAVMLQVIGQERTTNIHTATKKVIAPNWLTKGDQP